MNKEEKLQELEELENYYNNLLLIGDKDFIYKNFTITKDNKGHWVLKKFINKLDSICPNIGDSIEIPHFIQIIGKKAFLESGKNIKSVIIPDGVIKIESRAFAECNISKIRLPNTLKTIECEAFAECNIINLYVPDNVKHIGIYAFVNNEYMSALSLPSGVFVDNWSFIPHTWLDIFRLVSVIAVGIEFRYQRNQKR